MQTTRATIGLALATAALTLLQTGSHPREIHECFRAVAAVQANSATGVKTVLTAETERTPPFAEALRRMEFSVGRTIGVAPRCDPSISDSYHRDDRCSDHVIRFKQHEVLRVKFPVEIPGMAPVFVSGQGFAASSRHVF